MIKFTKSPIQIYSTLEKVCFKNIELCSITDCGSISCSPYFIFNLTDTFNVSFKGYHKPHHLVNLELTFFEDLYVRYKIKKFKNKLIKIKDDDEYLDNFKMLEVLKAKINHSELN